MDRDQYEDVREELFARVRTLTETKGRDYSGDDDALANFKRHARSLGLTPTQVWAVYAGKHWDAIQSYIRQTAQHSGVVESEPILGRVDDLVTCLTLLAALLIEADRIERGRAFATAQLGSRYEGPIIDHEAVERLAGETTDLVPGHAMGTLDGSVSQVVHQAQATRKRWSDAALEHDRDVDETHRIRPVRSDRDGQ